MKGYLLVADLLGFGNIMRNLEPPERDARVEEWVERVDGISNNLGLDRVQLISDTVFVGTDDDPSELGRLIDFSRDLLGGVRANLPIRGGISFGEFEWGRLTYGPAVVRAHELESAQNWIGVTVDGDVPGTEERWGFGQLVCYPPPLKSGPLRLHPVVDWDVPPADELGKLLVQRGLTRSGEVLNWGYGEKLNNTLAFSAYKKALRIENADPKHFFGSVPLEPIDAVLSGVRKAVPPTA